MFYGATNAAILDLRLIRSSRASVWIELSNEGLEGRIMLTRPRAPRRISPRTTIVSSRSRGPRASTELQLCHALEEPTHRGV
jgi:hypothetical protein